MFKDARYLITTSDESTWKFDRPVIFLGEWCRNYERRNIWLKMDAIVAAPYGLGKVKIDSDVAEASRIEEELFPILCKILNQFHKTDYSERFWKIVVGHWFHEYVTTMLNRFYTLQKCLSNYEISEVAGYDPSSHGLSVQTFSPSWYYALEDPRWNSMLYVKILELTSHNQFGVEKLPIDPVLDTRSGHIEESLPKQRTAKSYLFDVMKKLSPLLSKRNDAFIVSSYLPPEEEIKLQFALGQFPSFWATPKIDFNVKPDLALRAKITSELLNGEVEGLLKVAKALLFEIFPVAYLEGFSEIESIANKQKWPDKPKFIFTSNAFHSSDVYKYWFASKVERGIKYIVGQHGNSYFTNRWQQNSIEEVTSDKFLTWGWTDCSVRYSPAFIFQNNIQKPTKGNALGGLLLINTGPAISRQTYDASALALQYLELNQIFLENLSDGPREQMTLRLAAGTAQHSFSEKRRWLDFDSSLKIDEGLTPINQLISENRLIVHGYDSTGILITLSQNIPTLAFWLNGFEHLSDKVIADYELLLNAGIIHLTPESAAKQVNEVWDNIDEWWLGDKVQEARQEFCKKYARVSENPAKDLKTILLRATKNE